MNTVTCDNKTELNDLDNIIIDSIEIFDNPNKRKAAKNLLEFSLKKGYHITIGEYQLGYGENLNINPGDVSKVEAYSLLSEVCENSIKYGRNDLFEIINPYVKKLDDVINNSANYSSGYTVIFDPK
jgi:hypothetical protein